MNSNVPKRNKPLVLVVDDLESHLKAVGSSLVNSGYGVALALNGVKALEIARKTIPDLILLDILMPELDGLGVCEALKKDPETKDIPIIFLTSQKDNETILKGFELGAVDYIIKPANKEETLARVKIQLELKRSRETIIEQNEKLQELISDKTDFLSIASKDLRGPINEIRGYIDLLKSFKLEIFDPYLFKIDLLTKNMINVINDLLLINDIEEGRVRSIFKSVDVLTLISKVIQNNQASAKSKKISIGLDSKFSNQILVKADQEKLEIIINNLISNAVKFSKQPKSLSSPWSLISVRTSPTSFNGKDYVLIEVEDQGVGMSQQDLQQLFKKFNKLSSKPTGEEYSVGLGLPLVKLLVDEIGAKIGFESKLDVGTIVRLLVPVAD